MPHDPYVSLVVSRPKEILYTAIIDIDVMNILALVPLQVHIIIAGPRRFEYIVSQPMYSIDINRILVTQISCNSSPRMAADNLHDARD